MPLRGAGPHPSLRATLLARWREIFEDSALGTLLRCVMHLMMRPRPRLQHALLIAHCPLLTVVPILHPRHVTLSLPGRGCSEPSRRISPPSRRRTASWPSTSAPAGSTLLLEGALWWAHPSPLRASGLTRASLGPGLLCARQRRALAAQTSVATYGAASTHRSPLTTHHVPLT